ncbi:MULTISPECIES: DUF4179 domain-containing protein [unclassified Paenibacillus]|uniref:DUF4179 domain-containing protein n=1 Tax=unclassified Paenibacillus TaxID=185978 RepID=UPI000838F2BA|nr:MULTISPECIES: DUF4179 domain-containing protein [unclassified Paenibacillus]NWL88032.1 DUF4179 domain-containing protein [Paenibacillus sp. 79R4]
MRTVDKKFEEYKQNQLQAPSDLEGRLRNALQQVPVKQRKVNKTVVWISSAVAALILVVGAYEYPALAYYFNKVSLNSLSFAEVMEQGYGQKVDKSLTLNDGTVLTINGLIADDNVFRMYYTIDRPAGTEYTDEDFLRYSFVRVQGFLTQSKSLGGGGSPGKDKSQFIGESEFEPVSPFARTLTLVFNEWLDNGEKVSYSLSFDFEANKAMKSMIKEKLSESIAVDKGTIHYDYITASPTSTIVKGHYDLEEYPRFSGETKLYVNGIEVGRTRAEAHNPDFSLQFDPFPTDQIQSLELVLENFEGYHKINQPISLTSPSDRSMKVGDEKLWIRSVAKTKTGYDIVIARRQFTFLDTDSLAIQAGGKTVPVASISAERPWNLNNGNILWEQTYSFDTEDKPESLICDGYQYIKTYNKKISIPVDRRK